MPHETRAFLEAVTRVDDYDAALAAVMADPQGRWFLSEYIRRHRLKDNDGVLAAIGRIEEATLAESPLDADDALKNDLAEIGAALSAMRGVDDARADQLAELMRHLERRIAAMVEPIADAEPAVKAAADEPMQTATSDLGASEPEQVMDAEVPAEERAIEMLMPIDFVMPTPPPVDVIATPRPVEAEPESPPVTRVTPPLPVPQVTDEVPADPAADPAVDLADLERELFAGLPVGTVQPETETATAWERKPTASAAMPDEAKQPAGLRRDTLAAFKAMTTEEQIAVFS